MENTILFDIDGTLFNPQKFGQLIRSEFVKILNINEEQLISANADYYARLQDSTDFNPRDIALYLSARFNVEKDALDEVFWQNDEIYKESFYPEVFEVLKKLSEKFTLGIFSQGNSELQVRKLEAGGIKKYFSQNHILIHERKMENESIAKIPREATVIDDNHEIVVKLSSFVNAIWMNRRSEDNDPKVKTIHDLSVLVQ